ncbi:MAG: selenium cofactor biosynthesis protein YqeC [Eubacteriaceae bacterium]
MNLVEAFNIKDSDVVTITGGGGKTTLMFAIGKELLEMDKKHVITTTTKICLPEAYEGKALADEEPEEMIRLINESSNIQWILGNTMVDGYKIYGFSDQELTFLQRFISPTIILNEGDGAKRKPYKFYAHYEPVIPKITTKLIHVIGAEVFYKKINSDYFHRSEIYGNPTQIFDEEVFKLNLKNFLEEKIQPKCGDNVPKVLFINKVDEKKPDSVRIMGEIGKSVFDTVFIGSLHGNWIEKC